ncbi:type 1 glutamine amidotransferase domain-containing protein [Sorangium sp. So ce381]|uniref:type 1 glutamine amidotransferase domain-containing protein n=1 Tax=Sorangium sp. So ce381 TaxID=3133307 RepID=UPI003F5B0FFC
MTDIKDTLLRYYAYANAGDWAAWCDLFAENAVVDEQLAGHIEGLPALRRLMKNGLVGYAAFQNVPERVLVSGAEGAVLSRITGRTHTGAVISAPVMNYFVFDAAGKIAYMTNVHDTVPFAPLSDPANREGRMKKRILVGLSEWGYWGEELVGPLHAFDAAGYEVTFFTPKGKRPVALGASLDPSYVDPPLGRSVTSQENAKRALELESSGRLARPKDLSRWFPERPYISSPTYLRELEAYHSALAERQSEIEAYDALLLVGGSGALLDLVNNFRVHDLILAFYRLGKPIATECYAVGCLAFAREEDRKSIIRGKHVTGHLLEYDYKEGTGFVGTDFVMGPPPYPLEYILRDAVEPGGEYHANIGHPTSAIVDYPFITSRSTPDSYLCGELVVAVLEKGLRKYGWEA